MSKETRRIGPNELYQPASATYLALDNFDSETARLTYVSVPALQPSADGEPVFGLSLVRSTSTNGGFTTSLNLHRLSRKDLETIGNAIAAALAKEVQS